jgi:hypothetical protein
MNYKKLHDSIIDRAKIREYDSSIHHKHHIIPRHEDTTSTDVVPVTFKEHYILHFLRWKMTNSVGNKLAYLFMRGIRTIDAQKAMASMGGKLGGRKTRETNKGIFDPKWNRGEQTRKNWENGVLDHIDFNELSKLGGRKTRETNKGIFDPNLQHLRSYWAKIGAAALNKTNNRKGCATKEWIAQNYEKQKENSSLGGKIGGVITGSKLWWNNGTVNKRSHDSPGDDWVRGMIMSEKKRNQVYNQLLKGTQNDK